MRFTIIVILSLILSGCERGLDTLSSWLRGTETNTVILSPVELKIGPSGKKFYVDNGVEIVGDSVSVCVPLRGNFPAQDQEAMNAEYERLLNGASLRAVIETSEGREISMNRWGRSWSMYGEVFDKNEMAACVHVNCDEAGIAPGTEINAITIFATKELKVGGAYWESTDRWDGGD